MIGGLSLFLFTPAFAQELSDEAVPMNGLPITFRKNCRR